MWSARFARVAISSRANVRCRSRAGRLARGDERGRVRGGDGFELQQPSSRLPEILVDGADAHVIRERETFEDIIRGEKIVELKAR